MKTFFRYHLREYLFYTSVFFFLFSVIITLVKGIFGLQKFFELNPSLKEVFLNFGLLFLQLTSFILPLSVFLGVMFGVHRFKEDRELLGFFSLGFRFSEFFKPLCAFMLLGFVLLFLAHFWLVPYAKKLQKTMRFELTQRQFEEPLPEKRAIPLGENHVIYVEKAKKQDKAHEFERVFLVEKGAEKKQVFLAEKGRLDPKEGFFTLYQGEGFSLGKDKTVEVFRFGEYQFFLVVKEGEQMVEFGRGELSFPELKARLKEVEKNRGQWFRYLTEYWDRFFYPLSLFLVVFQGFLTAFFMKTHNRFLVFFTAVALYVVFYVGYQLCHSLAENGRVYPVVSFAGFYLVFGALVGLEAWFLFKKKRHQVYL